MTDKFLTTAVTVSNFLLSVAKQNTERCPQTMPWSDFAYGEALERWESNGRDDQDFFSTEDPWFLEFREELQEEFGLTILSPEEAAERHKISPIHFRIKLVDGFGNNNQWEIN